MFDIKIIIILYDVTEPLIDALSKYTMDGKKNQNADLTRQDW